MKVKFKIVDCCGEPIETVVLDVMIPSTPCYGSDCAASDYGRAYAESDDDVCGKLCCVNGYSQHDLCDDYTDAALNASSVVQSVCAVCRGNSYSVRFEGFVDG